MKKSVLIVLLLSSLSVFAQKNGHRFDFRLGIGVSKLGSGDMTATVLENELNRQISDYFTISASINYGRSDDGVSLTASYLQENVNLFVSPFKNSGVNDFRIGTGLTVYQVSDVAPVNNDLVYDSRSSVGYNIILEDSYNVSDRFLIGAKLFTQSYRNFDINTGGMIKVGFRF